MVTGATEAYELSVRNKLKVLLKKELAKLFAMAGCLRPGDQQHQLPSID